MRPKSKIQSEYFSSSGSIILKSMGFSSAPLNEARCVYNYSSDVKQRLKELMKRNDRNVEVMKTYSLHLALYFGLICEDYHHEQSL